MRRLWRVLEIVLVVGTFAGASTLGTLAVLGESGPAGASGGVLPFDPAGLRTAGEIKACLTGNGVALTTANFPTPADATAVAANLPNGDPVLILVFQTESSAAQFREAFDGLQPPGGLTLELDNVLLAYQVPPDAQARLDVEGCILGEEFGPPVTEEPVVPGEPVAICLTEAGFQVEDISTAHELPVTSLRVTQADDLVFVFLFDSEAAADDFQEVYGPGQVVHDLGLAVVEYEGEPAPLLAATVEGCAQPADV